MRRSVIALLAICTWPGSGLAGEHLTPEAIIEFFTKDAAADQGDQARTRGVVIGQPGDAGTRSVFLGPAGFGDDSGTGAESGSSPAPAGLDLLINFDLDSAKLTGDARRNLDALIEALHDPALADLRFEVAGHTDATGPADYNLALSKRRAAAVVNYLAAHGVDRSRMAAQGYGETRPRTPDAENPVNRRVETSRLR